METNLKVGVGVAVAVVIVLVAAGIYAAYVLNAAPSPCVGISTPVGPTPNVTVLHTGIHPLPTSSASTPQSPATYSPGPGDPKGTVPPSATPSVAGPGLVINVVAGENFWGSLVGQLGGTHVNVTSIISDPNTDPHEFQSNDSVAIAISKAQYIILNNVGYDTWATEAVAGDGATGQTVLNIGDSLGVRVTGGIVTGNPHLWYNPTYVNQTVAWMYDNLTTIATADGWSNLTGYFTDQYHNLTSSLASLYDEVGVIKHDFGGTVVAATESIFVYLANATGLNLVSPPAFMEAVAEANDPPDASVVTFQCQLESGHVKVLVFNAQTVTPITTNMKAIAQESNVSVMSVTETIVPPDTTFQAWMGGELNALFVALDANALGQ